MLVICTMILLLGLNLCSLEPTLGRQSLGEHSSVSGQAVGQVGLCPLWPSFLLVQQHTNTLGENNTRVSSR